jgi:hypothetical protein
MKNNICSMKKGLKQFIKGEINKLQKIMFLEQKLQLIKEELNQLNEGEWPEKLKKGRFTSYCKKQGFEGGANIECAKKAMNSDDASVRGMASFYMNTVKPHGKTAADLEEDVNAPESTAKKLAQWYFNEYNGDYNKIRNAALNNIVNSKYERFSNSYVTDFWNEIKKLEKDQPKEKNTLSQLKEECKRLEQKLFKN